MTPQKSSGRHRRLEIAITQVQRRWGVCALRPLSQAKASPPALSTGFASLDQATGIGGFPRGRISELSGPPTSGKTSLALLSAARAQQRGGICAYFDLGQDLDPDYARRCGIDLQRFLIVRPPRSAETLTIAVSLVRHQGLQLIVFDARTDFWPATEAMRRLASDLRLLNMALSSTPCVALFLMTDAPNQRPSPALRLPLPEHSALHLRVVQERWIRQPWRDITGYVAVIVVAKNKLGSPGKRATISVIFNNIVYGRDGAWDGGRL